MSEVNLQHFSWCIGPNRTCIYPPEATNIHPYIIMLLSNTLLTNLIEQIIYVYIEMDFGVIYIIVR